VQKQRGLRAISFRVGQNRAADYAKSDAHANSASLRSISWWVRAAAERRKLTIRDRDDWGKSLERRQNNHFRRQTNSVPGDLSNIKVLGLWVYEDIILSSLEPHFKRQNSHLSFRIHLVLLTSFSAEKAELRKSWERGGEAVATA